MHAVLLTFRSSVELNELVEPFTQYALQLRDVEGLVSKTWLSGDDAIGGFHIFISRKAADNYLNSQMVAELVSHPTFSDFNVQHFSILDKLSLVTGTMHPTSYP